MSYLFRSGRPEDEQKGQVLGPPDYVIECNGKVVGWAYVYFLGKEANIPAFQTDPPKSGHGRRFLSEIESLARQKGVTIVHATDVTENKVGFWKKMGYELTSNPDGPLIYSKKLE